LLSPEGFDLPPLSAVIRSRPQLSIFMVVGACSPVFCPDVIGSWFVWPGQPRAFTPDFCLHPDPFLGPFRFLDTVYRGIK